MIIATVNDRPLKQLLLLWSVSFLTWRWQGSPCYHVSRPPVIFLAIVTMSAIPVTVTLKERVAVFRKDEHLRGWYKWSSLQRHSWRGKPILFKQMSSDIIRVLCLKKYRVSEFQTPAMEFARWKSTCRRSEKRSLEFLYSIFSLSVHLTQRDRSLRGNWDRLFIDS